MRHRLGLIEAVLAAVERHHEVADVVYGSNSSADAVVSLTELLELEDPDMARAVLDMQTRRMTKDERDRLAATADELRGGLGF